MSYQGLLDRLAPETMQAMIDNRINLATRSFPLQANSVANFEELLEHLARFGCHLLEGYYDRQDVSEEEGSFFVQTLLQAGSIRLEQRYDDCQRGINGGLATLLNDIAEAFIQQQTRAYIDHAINEEVGNRLNYEEIEEMMQEYLRRFGRHLGFQTRDIGSLVINWERILRNHAQILANIRRDVGRF